MRATIAIPGALLAAGCVSAALVAPLRAHAGSRSDNSGSFSIDVPLAFRVAYPRFLRFRVGSPGAGVIDRITFAPASTSLGTSVPVTGTGGDAGGSTATVEIAGNFGQITITPTNNSAGLGLGTGSVADGYIAYAEIETVSDDASLPAPVLANSGGTASQPALNGAFVTHRTAQWTYRYLNTTVPSAGIYGAGGGTGGRVTYTATMP